jgi:glycolate oxidase
MEVVTADGTILKLGKRTSKGVTGYDLTSLIVGSEGTLAIVTEATLKLLPKPEAIVTVLVFLPDLVTAGRAVGATFAQGVMPRCVEMLDHLTLDLIRASSPVAIPPAARAMLLIELDGPTVALEPQLERMGDALDAAGALSVLVARHGGEREKLWAARRELSHALRRTARFKLAEDVVVPRSKIPQLIEICQVIAERESISMPSYGHAGDGNIHVNLLWNDPEQQAAVDRAIFSLFEAVVGLGGTLSGEHGIGVLKAPYLHLEQSAEVIAWQRKIKDTFDPRGILNPGKIFTDDGGRSHGAC